MKFKGLLILVGLIVINGCDSGSDVAGPTSDPITYVSLVSMGLSGVDNNFVNDLSEQNNFKVSLASELGIIPDVIEIISVTSTTRADVNIDMYFIGCSDWCDPLDLDPAFNDIEECTTYCGGVVVENVLSDLQQIDEISGYSITVEITELPADCHGVPNGTSVEDCNGLCDGSAVEDACGVCDGDGMSCVSINDLFQGTWNVVEGCITGDVPNQFYNGCINVTNQCDTYSNTTATVNGNTMEFCDGGYGGYNQCDTTTFSLSGNTLTFSYYGQSMSLTINISSDGQSLTLSGLINDYGCSSTLTEYWEK